MDSKYGSIYRKWFLLFLLQQSIRKRNAGGGREGEGIHIGVGYTGTAFPLRPHWRRRKRRRRKGGWKECLLHFYCIPIAFLCIPVGGGGLDGEKDGIFLVFSYCIPKCVPAVFRMRSLSNPYWRRKG